MSFGKGGGRGARAPWAGAGRGDDECTCADDRTSFGLAASCQPQDRVPADELERGLSSRRRRDGQTTSGAATMPADCCAATPRCCQLGQPRKALTGSPTDRSVRPHTTIACPLHTRLLSSRPDRIAPTLLAVAQEGEPSRRQSQPRTEPSPAAPAQSSPGPRPSPSPPPPAPPAAGPARHALERDPDRRPVG